VLIKVAELARKPEADLATLCELLRTDGPLTADIIRISNSPYCAPATLHSNLTSAVSYIGMREVLRVANLSLSRRMFARDLPSYGISAADYWSASIAAALVMETVAIKSGLNPEDAFTIGILHAIGRVLINHVIEEQRFTIYWDGKQPIQDWEHAAVGFNYAESGAMLLEHWRFPALTCDIIRQQLDPAKSAEPVSQFGALQFTLRLLALTGWKFENKGWELPDADPFMRAAGIAPSMLTRSLLECEKDFQQIIKTG
jgi:HD-like signal output (HDOD) protein